MAGNRNWAKAEDRIVRKYKSEPPEMIRVRLERAGYQRTWGAVFSRWQLLTGRRKREGTGKFGREVA